MEGEEKTECTEDDEWSSPLPKCFGALDKTEYM